MEPEISYIVDTDNGLGSSSGDVDDGFALSAMLAAKLCITGIVPTAGNVAESESRANCIALTKVLGVSSTLVCSGSEAALRCTLPGAAKNVRYLAMGPLTSLAQRVTADGSMPEVSEVVIVGGNTSSFGFLQPVWPFEYNLTKDRSAFGSVFRTSLPLTFIPLNVACKMKVSWEQVASLKGVLGEFIAHGSGHWFRRARVLKCAKKVAVWDLVVAAYILWPDLCFSKAVDARIDWSGRVRWSSTGTRPTRVVTSFDAQEVWRRFEEVIAHWK